MEQKPKRKKGITKQKYICADCGISFIKYEKLVKTITPCCSYSCSNRFSKKNNPYPRTKEHRQKMSQAIKNSPHEKQRQAIITFNKFRKGKTFTQIYGIEKAMDLLKLYSKRIIGEKNFNFIDGRSYLPYPIAFNRTLKNEIKKLDQFVCVKCGISDEQCRKADSLGRGLTIHHVDFNKNNCSIDNLVATCRRCNSWANWHSC